MTINKIKGINPLGSNDDGPDLTDPRAFLNSIFGHLNAPPAQLPHGPQEPQGPHESHDPHGPQSTTLEFRSIDGSGNNTVHTELNAVAGTDFVRTGPVNFADGVQEMVEGPNPRMISNTVVAGHGDEANPQGLSGMMYAWGQFIDHDLDLEQTGGANISIAINQPDADLPNATEIPLTRALIDPATGHDGIPAAAINTISGWMDASMIYGSDATTAASLRGTGGHMLTSTGDLLPTVDAPNPANPSETVSMFMAGDVRAQENSDLTALQTMFVREHNFQVDRLHELHPNWDDENLYQNARAIVTAEIEHVTYDEFLPHLLGAGAIDRYTGYDSSVDPRISVEFAGAAFRFGHSLVSAELEGINEQGMTTADQALKDAFFETADAFAANGGADGLIRHLGADLSNKFDIHIVDDLRNFLFAPPDALDLASINIQRGRDLGLGTLNEVRENLGMEKYTSFDQISSDPETTQNLETAYGTVDKIDLWTGGLSEDAVAGAMVGETFGKIIATQFENLRDGDRLWYQNQGFDAQTLDIIKNTTLGDIMERNTDIDHMQDDVFVYYNRHSGTQAGIVAEDPDAPQLVVGSVGSDTLIGGPQKDLLVAATGGTQTMTGDAGADRFIIGHGMNAEITDFKPGEDKIVLENAGQLDLHGVNIQSDHGNAVAEAKGSHNLHGVNIKSDHGNTVVEANGSHIVLLGINPFQLHAHDIIDHI